MTITIERAKEIFAPMDAELRRHSWSEPDCHIQVSNWIAHGKVNVAYAFSCEFARFFHENHEEVSYSDAASFVYFNVFFNAEVGRQYGTDFLATHEHMLIAYANSFSIDNPEVVPEPSVLVVPSSSLMIQ